MYTVNQQQTKFMFLYDILVSVINVILVLQDAVSSIITRELHVSAYGILHTHWLVYLHVSYQYQDTFKQHLSVCLSPYPSLYLVPSTLLSLSTFLSLYLSLSLPLPLSLSLSLVLSTSLALKQLYSVSGSFISYSCFKTNGMQPGLSAISSHSQCRQPSLYNTMILCLNMSVRLTNYI